MCFVLSYSLSYFVPVVEKAYTTLEVKIQILKSNARLSGSLWDRGFSLSLFSAAALPGLLPFTSSVFLTLMQILLPKLFSPCPSLPYFPYLDFVSLALCLLSQSIWNSSPFIHLFCFSPYPLLFSTNPCLPGHPPSPPPLYLPLCFTTSLPPALSLLSPPLLFFLQTESQFELSKQMRGVWDHLNIHK